MLIWWRVGATRDFPSVVLCTRTWRYVNRAISNRRRRLLWVGIEVVIPKEDRDRGQLEIDNTMAVSYDFGNGETSLNSQNTERVGPSISTASTDLPSTLNQQSSLLTRS